MLSHVRIGLQACNFQVFARSIAVFPRSDPRKNFILRA